MIWKFEQEESASGGYTLKAIRSTGNEVSLRVDESKLYRIYKEAFYLEVSLGTPLTKALFEVISSSKVSWLSKYNEAASGSWLVASPNGTDRYVFDGNNSSLKYYADDTSPAWQCCIKEKSDVNEQVFASLISR